jgi:glucose/arabinose dehydrogenase
MNKATLLTFAFFSLSLTAFSQQPPRVSLVQVASGLGKITDIKNAGDSRLFIVEQTGLIRILDSTYAAKPTPFMNIVSRVRSTGSEQGLLGLAFHPNYKQNGYFYVNYIDKSGTSGATVVSRFKVSSNPDLADTSTEFKLLVVPQPYSNHNGGNLEFGPDGYLYIGLGDGGNQGDPGNRAQNKKNYLGKMLRIDVDKASPYGIPSDNPYFGDTTYYQEIWAMGLRNPWKYSFDKMTGDLWIGDVGQNVWEEIDFQPASSNGGENYGWRCYEASASYNTSGCGSASGYVKPVYEFSHSTPNGCSVTGGYVYRGAQYSKLFGWYVHSDYCSSQLRATIRDSLGAWKTFNLAKYSSNHTTFGQDVYGELYVGGQASGQVWRIQDSTCAPVAFISFEDTLKVCGDSLVLKAHFGKGLTYQWQKNGSDITGATSSVFTAKSGGNYTVKVTKSAGCVSTSAPVTVILNTVPKVNFTGLDSMYCFNTAPFTLNASPAGGTFSGRGVAGNTYDPSKAGAGKDTITYTVTDSNGCTGSLSREVTIDLCTSVNEKDAVKNISVFPNPSKSKFSLEFSLEEKRQVQIRITGMNGQLCYLKEKEFPSGSHRIRVELENAAAGIYSLTIKSGTEYHLRQFVVEK